MKSLKTFAFAALTAMVLASPVDMASARPYHRAYRHFGNHHRDVGAGLAAGAALGLLGAGIAGAATAGNGYGYGYPAYGYGYPGYGSYGPGYGYYGY